MLGSGGREHALIKKLKESPKAGKIYCAPGNGGISKDAECVNISVMDKENIIAFAKEKNIDLVFVAPDDPLAAGVVDALNDAGIRAFGPVAKAAEIESSKVFSKNLMKKYNIPFSPPDISEEEISEVVDTLKSGWITTGPKTKTFEREIANYCHTEDAACLNSATAALEMALRILGVGPGDEVITTVYTYTASASVVCHVGAKLLSRYGKRFL